MHDKDENIIYHVLNTIEEEKIEEMNDLKLFNKNLSFRVTVYNNNNDSSSNSNNSNSESKTTVLTLSFYDYPSFERKMRDYVIIDEINQTKQKKGKAF